MGLEVLGLFNGNSNARKASDAVKAGDQKGIDAINGQFQQTQQNFQPYLNYGQGAGGLGGLQSLMSGDYSGFMNSPDYLASQKAGIYALDHSAAAKGRLNSGGFAADLQNAGQDHAAGYLGNYRNALFQGANLGQQSASALGSYGAQAANGIASLYQDQGAARAGKYSAYGNNGNAFISSLSSMAGNLFGGG